MSKQCDHGQLRQKLRRAGELGLSVLLEGPAGTGKTSLVLQVASELGLRLKYYSASTLDPFVDLVGLPVPVTRENGGRSLEFHRQTDLMQAQLLFFDELNRAHSKVLNAVLEIIQFQTINGDKLPHLRAIFAACNPAHDAYQVMELDPALVDRFQVHLKFGNAPDRTWFVDHYGVTGTALCDWWTLDLTAEQQALVSPRKLEHMAKLHAAGCDPEDAMPVRDQQLPFHLLRQRLDGPGSVTDIKDFVDAPEAYALLVSSDPGMALRFVQLLPLMKPLQLWAVRMILFGLPREFLAQVSAQPDTFRRMFRAIAVREGVAEVKAFRELLEEQLGFPIK